MNLRIFVDVVGEPGSDDGGRIGAPVVQSAHILEGASNGVLDRRPEEIRLAVEIVIDERRVDVERLGYVLDGHRGKIALGKKIERRGQKFLDTGAAMVFPAGPLQTVLAEPSLTPFAAAKIAGGLLRHSARLGPLAPTRDAVF